MTEFEFDRAPTPGTNRTAAVTDCPTCGGDRFVPVDQHDRDLGYEAYARCPDCNPEPEAKR